MVYSNKFVMCVLLNGQPQEEKANGQVSLPFGTEYALRFRNKNTRRAVVKIYIDGENVSGEGYVVDAHSHVDIKRHHDIDRAFKFVSLDSPEAVDHGKNGPNEDKVKGTIEARFYLEKERPNVIYRDVHHDHHHHHHHDHYRPVPMPRPVWPCLNNPYDLNNHDGSRYTCDSSPDEGGMDVTCSNEMSGGGGTTSSLGSGASSTRRNAMKKGLETCSLNDPDIATFKRISTQKLKDGATVEGYSTGQNFHSVYIDQETTFTSLKIFLQGFDEEVPVKRPAKKVRRNTVKDDSIADLEAENEELRRKIAEIENEKLKDQLDQAELGKLCKL